MNKFFLLSLFFIFTCQELYAADRLTVREECKRPTFTNGVYMLKIDLFDAVQDPDYGTGEVGGRMGSSYYILEFTKGGLLKQINEGYDYSPYGSNYITNETIKAYPKVDGVNYSMLTTKKVQNKRACQVSLSLLVHHNDTDQFGTSTLNTGVDFEGSGIVSGYQLETGEPDVIELSDSFVTLYNDYYNGSLNNWGYERRAHATLTRLYTRF